MIDIHAHILPEIDDGAPSLDTSLAMAEIAVSTGVDTMIMTPHCNIPDYYDNYYSLPLMQAFRNLRRALDDAGIPLQVLPGMEIFCTPDLPSLISSRKVVGLNFSNYLLVEFNFGAEPDWMTQQLQNILNTGRIPVIAHPERYDAVFEIPEITAAWAQMGCLLQCNKGSFLGSFGRQVENTAHLLLEHHLVSFIASDAHRPDRRTPHMHEIYQYIAHQYSAETAHSLMQANPMRICRNKPVPREKIIPFDSRSYWLMEDE